MRSRTIAALASIGVLSLAATPVAAAAASTHKADPKSDRSARVVKAEKRSKDSKVDRNSPVDRLNDR